MIILVILLVKNRQYNNNNKIVTLKTTDPKEFEEFMREHNFPEEMIEEMQEGNINVTTTKTVRKVKYINGQKVSDVTETTTNKPLPATYCPNCGAKLEENTNNTCHYCNQTFK